MRGSAASILAGSGRVSISFAGGDMRAPSWRSGRLAPEHSAARSVGRRGESFDEFGRLIDWREQSNLSCDLTSAVPVLPVVEKPTQPSSDVLGGSFVLA